MSDGLMEASKLDGYIFESSMDMIIVTDQERNIVRFNKMAEKVFGYDRSEVIGKCVDILYDDPQEGQKIGAKIADDGSFFIEIKNRRKNGELFYSRLSASALLDKNGERIGNMGISRDISEQKKLEYDLKISNEALQNSSDAIFLVNMQGNFVFVNRALCNLSGFACDELLGANISRLDSNFSTQELLSKILKHIKQDGSFSMESTFSMKEGGHVPVELNATYVNFEENELFCAFARDISDRKRAELALWESNQRFFATFEQAAVGIAHVDPQGIFIGANEKLCDMAGIDKQRMIGTSFDQIVPLFDETSKDNGIEALLKGKINTFSIDRKLKKSKGVTIWVTLTVSLVRDCTDKPNYFIVVVNDITVQKLIEQQLKNSLVELEKKVEHEKLQKVEKEVMLKEIHHRVKNNMQIISSIFNLQLKNAKNDEVAQLLKNAQNRIHSMALVHDLLYQSENLAQVDMRAYVNELVVDILTSLHSDTMLIDPKIEIDEFYFGPDRAITIGIIVNELVVNAIKHAFSGRTNGTIEVTLKKIDETQAKLTVADNGVGIDTNEPLKKSLGMELITVFCQTLECQTDISYEKGVRFSIEFNTAAARGA